MQFSLLTILTSIVFIFCVVDLTHLYLILKTLKKMNFYMANMQINIAEIRKKGLYRGKGHFKHRGHQNHQKSGSKLRSGPKTGQNRGGGASAISNRQNI